MFIVNLFLFLSFSLIVFFILINNSNNKSGFNLKTVWYLLTKELVFSLVFLISLCLLLAATSSFPIAFPLSFLAIFIAFVKLAEWIDDRFLDDKIGQWITSQKVVFLELIPNSDKSISESDMEKFFQLLHSISGKRTEKNFRTTGKFYEDIAWEIHSDGGKIHWYVKMNKSVLDVFFYAVKISLPQLQVLECKDPLESWPKTWIEIEKDYTDLIASELRFPKKDLYSLKSLREIFEEKKGQTFEPVVSLLATLENVDPEDYIILQWVLRPLEPNPSDWATTLNDLKKDFANNTSFELSKGQLQVYTQQELALINSATNKLNSLCYLTKLRFLLLGKKTTAKKYLAGIMSYFKQFATPIQALIPSIKTWEDDPKSTLWDEVYWKPENKKRSRQIYVSVLNRSMAKGNPPQYWSTRDLASILILPASTVTYKEFLKTKQEETNNLQEKKIVEQNLSEDKEKFSSEKLQQLKQKVTQNK